MSIGYIYKKFESKLISLVSLFFPVMRLGKKKEKEKDSDNKCQFVEGVSRLICSPKTHNVPLRGNIELHLRVAHALIAGQTLDLIVPQAKKEKDRKED